MKNTSRLRVPIAYKEKNMTYLFCSSAGVLSVVSLTKTIP